MNTVVRETDVTKYFELASEYFDAMVVLCNTNSFVSPSGTVASLATEICLKSFLLSKGVSKKQLKKIGHDLIAALNLAILNGLRIEQEGNVRFSVGSLSINYNQPYHYRYPLIGTGTCIPVSSELIRDIGAIFDSVKKGINSNENPSQIK